MKIFKFILLFFAFYSSVYANNNNGWIITGRYIGRGNTVYLQRYFVTDDKIKFEQYNIMYSYNFRTDSLVLIDIENMVCTKTTIDEYKTVSQDLFNQALKESFINMIESQLDVDTSGIIVNADLSFYPISNDSIKIIKIADADSLLGHKVAEYAVYVSGKRVERFFHTFDVSFYKNIDLTKFNNIEHFLHPTDYSFDYTDTDKYKYYKKNGLIIRRFLYIDDFTEEYQVNRYEKKEIPDWEFEIPYQCKKVDIKQWFDYNHPSLNEYDDYE